ncbi:Ubiquitin carboxyl-terminal hydrolase 31, partial [Ophiophagus hannah]
MQRSPAAYCKNSVDGLWYCFDDSEVQQLAENEVCKPTAYILFYQRRTAIPAWSANSSVAGKSRSCCHSSQPSLRVKQSELFLLILGKASLALCSPVLTPKPGSTSSSLCEHWVSRLPGSKPPSVTSAASSRRTSLASLSESVELMGERSEDDGAYMGGRGDGSWGLASFPVPAAQSSARGPVLATGVLESEEGAWLPAWGRPRRVFNPALREERPAPELVFQILSDQPFGHQRKRDPPIVMRSNSASPVHGSSATLERIGESADDRVATSCFGSRRSLSGSPLEPRAAGSSHRGQQDSRTLGRGGDRQYLPQKSDDAPGWKGPGKTGPQVDRNAPLGPFDNNNQIAFDSLTSHRLVASPPSSKALPKAPRSRSKLDSCRASGRPGSPVARPGKKDTGGKGPEAASAPSAQPKHRPARRSSSGGSGRGHPPSGKSRTSERGLSREGSKLSMGSEKTGGAASPRTNSPRLGQVRGEGRAPESKHVRSTSLASLRSPGPGPRSSLKRDSKSEEKGLSFFKSALRQKETRRSADLGKTTLLAKKAVGGSCKAAGKTLSEEKLPEKATLPNASVAAKDPLIPTKRSLLTACKSQSSQLEGSPKSPGGGRPAINKALPKLPPGVSSSTCTSSMSP